MRALADTLAPLIGDDATRKHLAWRRMNIAIANLIAGMKHA